MQYKKSILSSFIVFAVLFSISCKRIPSPAGRNRTVVSKTTSEYYYVRPGDTLFSISRKFDITVDYIQKVNNIKNANFLSVGQRLYIGKKDIKLDNAGEKKESVKIADERSQKNENKKKVTSAKNKTGVNTSARSSGKRFIIMPSSGNIVYKFGDMKNGIRLEGMEILNTGDTSVKATGDGDIVYVDEEEKNRILIIDHKNNFYTVYSELSDVNVKMGDVVRKGDIVGHSRKGQSFYFELKRFQNENNPVAVDPGDYVIK